MSCLPARALASFLICCLLAGCGLTIPEIQEIGDRDFPAAPGTPKITATAQIEFEIERKVYCELKEAVREAQKYPVSASASPGGKWTVKQKGLIPPDWGVQIALSLQVDESVALSPGVTLNRVLPNAIKAFGVGNSVTVGQAFNLGFGATLSSTATRIHKFNPYYSIALLSKPPTVNSTCKPENDPFVRNGLTPASSSPLIIESDLGIKDWLVGAMFLDNLLPSDSVKSQSGATTKPRSITHEIKFVIVSSGNVTPTWKLVDVAANTSGSLFATGRTRTHDLIITIGPATTQTNNAHFTSQINAAINR